MLSAHPRITESIPLTNLMAISEERHRKMFAPIPNPYSKDGDERHPLHAALLDPHEEKQLQHVKDVFKKDPRRVWTLMDVHNQDVLVSGYQYATRIGFCRLGYVICRTAINEGMEMYMPLDHMLM